MLIRLLSLSSLAALAILPSATTKPWSGADSENAAAACAALKQQIPHVVHFPGMCLKPIYLCDSLENPPLIFKKELRNTSKT
jgi:hypothetical protein